jgi:hypothetical protein
MDKRQLLLTNSPMFIILHFLSNQYWNDPSPFFLPVHFVQHLNLIFLY